MRGKMKERLRSSTIRFLLFSITFIAVLCVCTFSFLAVYMNRKSAEAIKKVANIYMSSVSEQVSRHFETVISLRMEQVEALADMVKADNEENAGQMYDTLAHSARVRDFDYLAFYMDDGTIEDIYGEHIESIDPQPFVNSLKSREKKIALGANDKGEKIILLGCPIQHSVAGGRECIALVAGIPAKYLTDTLALETNDQTVYSFIIRRDGDYVIRTADEYRDNYFERVESVYEDIDGKSTEQYLAELRAAMEAQEDYSSVFQIYGERRHLYCSSLPSSEWYLFTFMSYDALDNTISDFSRHWIFLAMGYCILIACVLLWLFSRYFKMTKKQMAELEDAKQAAERASKAKSEFLSNMSHDIRTPMNAIVGLTAIAASDIDNKQSVQNCLKKITTSSRHLLGIINDVLDMAKIESGKMTLNRESVSLRELMDGLVNIIQQQVKVKKQNFNVNIHDITAENVCTDGVRLNQILLNLLSNAVKFTPEGGSIQVSVYEEESPEGEDYVRVHFQVKDNGIGMSPEFKEHVFESFEREDSGRVHRTEGTGLGMTICKYIVDAMNGEITVESELGKGTEFNVTLDLLKEEISEVDMILPNWNMLVVDDDRQLCESTTQCLKSIGIDAEWTLNGENALRMVEQKHQQGADYHVILLDWKLPEMDGIETARAIRKLMGEEIPILLISAYDWAEIEDDARAAGVNGFIAKPLFKSTLFYGLRPFAESLNESAKEPEKKEFALSGRKILLAEDLELNWEVAKELLNGLGLEVDWAENGQICLNMFQNSQEGYYDAILMDVRMPVMNGYEATRAIRALERADAGRVPIIAMTADAFSEDIQKCLDAGMNAHTAKPIDVREVARLLEKYI
ncbi:MAG: response regulator [Clostridium sp.]|nr:response regulator [Clostridium sp.]